MQSFLLLLRSGTLYELAPQIAPSMYCKLLALGGNLLAWVGKMTMLVFYIAVQHQNNIPPFSSFSFLPYPFSFPRSAEISDRAGPLTNQPTCVPIHTTIGIFATSPSSCAPPFCLVTRWSMVALRENVQ